MAVPIMHSTATQTGKTYQEQRAVPGQSTKAPSTSAATQQAPSRPSSAAPGSKAGKEVAKSPNTTAEDLPGNFKEGTSISNDVLRSAQPPNMTFPLDAGAVPNSGPLRAGTGNANQGFIPHPFFNTAATMNMNVPSQTGYGAPPIQFYGPAGYGNPSAYPGSQHSTQTRPIPPMQPKFGTNMDPKFGPSQSGPIGPSSVSPPMANNMSRRPSNYFVPPSMSPVQTSYAPRGWIGGNAPPIMPGPMGPLQNGGAPVQNAAVYTPAMLTPNPNPPLLTPPGPVAPAFAPAFGTAPALPANPPFGYPTPPEAPAGSNPDIPPPVPSLYPDPAYNNINNCIYNPKGTTNVYIRGLRPETTDEDLLRMVRHYGEIISTKAIIDTQTKMCKGFGFAKFQSMEQGVACIIGLSGYGYQCSFAKESFSNRLKELSEPSNTNLYISNLPLDVDEQRLDDLLKPYRVHSSRILRDNNKASRGVGFARMTDRESAEKIVEQWNGKCYPGSDLPLQVRFADTPMQKRLKSVTARRRSWRAKEYNSLTQGRPMSPSTQRFYEESFGSTTMEYSGGQLYGNGNGWQPEAFAGYALETGPEGHHPVPL